jgi:lipoprotein-releasing system permease protein
MKSEKWAVYLILTLILIIAVFNLAGSLTMLIISKQKDIAVMQSMGADVSAIRKIFLTNGFMITMSGAMAGIIIGFLVCWLQLRFGLVHLGDPDAFVISKYPIEMQLTDFIYIFLTVVAIGLASALYPSAKVIKRERQIRVADAV